MSKRRASPNPYDAPVRPERQITDTAKNARTSGGALELLAFSMGGGGMSRVIEEQERAGQNELLRSMQLPRNMGRREDYEKLGFRFAEVSGKQVTGDKLFLDAALPTGWKKVATDHSMWSNLVDAKGRVRARIFYKAAFYDRDAHMHLIPRFTAKQLRSDDGAIPPERDGEYVFLDTVMGKELFSAGAKREGWGPDRQWVSPSEDCVTFAKGYMEGKDPYDFDAVYE